MGGKGQKRREKNYRAAHGGNNRLPPPPDPSSVDALPSNLRKLMNYIQQGSRKEAKIHNEQNNRRVDGGLDEKIHSECHLNSDVAGKQKKKDDNKLDLQHMDHSGEMVENSSPEKKMKKRKKRKQVDDLRFGTAEESSTAGLKRKERKKRRLEERKKKRKKAKDVEDLDFPGREQIKFGDVVEAPPKLIHAPKVMKAPHSASHERLRKRAVEAYRQRRGWTSRLGIQLPPPTITPSSS